MGDEEEQEEGQQKQASQMKTKRKKRDDEKQSLAMKKPKLTPGDEGYDPYDFDQQDDEQDSGKLFRTRDGTHIGCFKIKSVIKCILLV